MRHLIRKDALVVFVVAVATVMWAAMLPAQKPAFEVVSVKPSPPGVRNFRFAAAGGRFSAAPITLRRLSQIAYQPQDGTVFLNNRIIGAPGWVDTDQFDVEAKTEEATPGPIPREKLQPMVQSLLEDRFQLKAHKEVRELPVYLLTVGKGGPKLKLSEDQSDYAAQPPNTPFEQRRGIIRRTDDGWIANAVRVGILISVLSQPLGRPVLDKTGLEGMFDFKLNWVEPRGAAPAATDATTPTASDPAGGSIFTAIDELGLKLESAKAPLEVLVIDSVQKPSEN